MVEVEDEVYEQLVKNANDNTSLIRLVKIVAILIIAVLIVFIYGTKLIDISLMYYRTNVQCNAAVLEAENRVKIREIESSGMTTEEYLKWLEIVSSEQME